MVVNLPRGFWCKSSEQGPKENETYENYGAVGETPSTKEEQEGPYMGLF